MAATCSLRDSDRITVWAGAIAVASTIITSVRPIDCESVCRQPDQQGVTLLCCRNRGLWGFALGLPRYLNGYWSDSPTRPLRLPLGYGANAGKNCDALAAIYKDGSQPTLSQSAWTNNDGYPVIELRAPMYSHVFFDTSGGSNTISLNASLYPWSDGGFPDNITYSIDRSAKLISLAGGMSLFGKALSLWNSPQNESHVGYFWCIWNTSQLAYLPGDEY